MKLAWSDLAKRELREIRQFSIKRWGLPVAARYVEDVRDAAKSAAAAPRRSRPLKGNYRILRVRSHYLVLQIDLANDRLIVARVLHSAMDLERHLP